MKRRLVLLVIAVCLTLSGCSLSIDGNYHSVQPHQDEQGEILHESATVTTYSELQSALVELIENGQQRSVIYMPGFEADRLTGYMNRVIDYIKRENPVAAYAVDAITYEIGTSGGMPAIAVQISYIHNRTEILRIQKAADMESAVVAIQNALDACDAGVLIRIAAYETTDFALLVQDYVEEHPDTCMETPLVTAVSYPETGDDRILELSFVYQTSRDSLRTMQQYVRPVFTAAGLNVSGEETQHDKFALMYVFLMERSEYQLETSITPAYSLLRHGVGDSKAFSTVYAAMCRRAELDCQVVSGTRNGEPWVWNLICQDGVYYHIDLLNEKNEGNLYLLTPEDMQEYVWDYSSYPQTGDGENNTSTGEIETPTDESGVS